MKKITTLTCLIVIFLFSCKKDKRKNNPFDKYLFSADCECSDPDIPELEGFNSGYEFYSPSDYIYSPVVNPANPNELLYCTKSTGMKAFDIFIFNRSEKTSTLLLNTELTSSPKWGQNGWILINSDSIYKVKSNGDSLTGLTVGYASEWNFDCTKFAYSVLDESKHKYIGVVYDFNSNKKDTLPFMLSSNICWQNRNGLLVYFRFHDNQHHFFVADIISKITTTVLDIVSPTPPAWLNENEFVYGHDQKLLKFNISNATITTIAKFCSNDFIGAFSFSPQSKELVTTIDHWKYLGGNKIQISNKIMILNFNDNSVTYINP